MTINQITLESARLHYKLQTAFRQAVIDEASISELMGSKKTIPLDVALLERFDQVTSHQLPEAFGRFISGLDLQQPFLNLGRYVRSFSGADFVIRSMEASILNQMEKFSITDPCKWIDDLVSCCQELSIICTSLNDAGQ